MISPYLCFSRYVPKHVEMNRNIHQTHLRAGRVGPESTYMMALSRTPQCVPDRRRWKTLVEPKVKRRAGLTGNYSNLCEFIYFTIRKNKERGSSSASKASLETVLPSRKTNPLFFNIRQVLVITKRKSRRKTCTDGVLSTGKRNKIF